MNARRSDGRASEDVRRELEAHVALAAQELIDAGWEPAAARTEAERRLGDFERLARAAEREVAASDRATERASRWESVVQDLRFGLRGLLRTPGFTLVAAATLALGIGANAAIFSVVHAVLLQPLPYAQPDRIVSVGERFRSGNVGRSAWPDLQDWREQGHAFDALAGYGFSPMLVLGGERPVRATGLASTEDLWRVLPVTPELGRLPVHEDHQPGAPPVVVITHRLWTGALGRAPDVIGRTLTVGDLRARVVGVLPDGFELPEHADLSVPAEASGAPGTSRGAHNWSVLGRLRAGASPAEAEAELTGITARATAASAEDPSYLAVGTSVRPWLDQLVGDARGPLWLLLGAAALVLLVACTNLASNLLARGETRTTEMAVRSSLGAGRGRLVRQLLTEGLLLAAIGTLGAVGLAALARRALIAFGPGSIPRLAEISIDPAVLVFTCALAAATLLVFGLWPALRLSREGPALALRAGRAGRRGVAWSALVGTEVALATVLVTGSGLLIHSLRRVLAQDAGFQDRDVLVADATPSALEHGDAAGVARVYDALLRDLSSDHAVTAAGLTTTVPMRPFYPNGRIVLDGDPTKVADAGYVLSSEGFFPALHIPLLAGRLFDPRDGADQPDAVVVSRAFAERYWPGQDPLGHQLTTGGMDDSPTRSATVIGVVGDVRYESLTRAPYPTLYLSVRQRPYRAQWGAFLTIAAAPGKTAEAAAAYRSAVARIDPNIPVEIAPLGDALAASIAQRRFVLSVLGAFAATAMALALVGIYGVVSYRVARRRRELGIRMALGAGSGRVLRLVMRGTVRAVGLGLAGGLLASLALGRVVRGLLYEISPLDPPALAASVAGLAAAALLATWLPARRTARIDPSIAMRAD